MLTRLKVSGFKNLVDVDVRFGAFTCIAGANGVGKSNLFDAIRFLSALADLPLIEAALSVRDEEGKTGDIRSLFHRVGNTYADEMSFEAEMIVPAEGEDDLGQKAKASITFLRYSIQLAYRADNSLRSLGALEILKEELVHINRGDAAKHLLFPNKSTTWRKTAVIGERRVPYFISTEGEDSNKIIKLHQDGGSSGRPLARSAINLPRTVLSVTNAAESPTALMARREMQSWRLLQLEPSSLRQPDEFTAPTKLETDGSHLAATLYHLARLKRNKNRQLNDDINNQVYYEIANRLATLINDVDKVWVDRDDRRELLTLMVTSRDGTSHPAKALSDGTMRFLALAVLALDPEAQGLLCLEEPENGIHPGRIPKILQLLQDIATDTNEAVGLDNPLRQVIINTHSPAVVMQVPEDSLLIAELRQTIRSGQRFKRVCFGYLPNTWRQLKDPNSSDTNIVSKGELLEYLNPVPNEDLEFDSNGDDTDSSKTKLTKSKKRRVVDREDLQLLLPGFSGEQR
ncbi:AAA family ATPase [Oscillatoria sp. FACHB-1407]|uniref:AAA family ATPase n=1 Tax=Oscillatoria sp. FACHB-1407 TaxID=2692847 RepID=UPI001688E8DB|nr:AAA family ATPase [Oscillatoria sp. FACHB-1407]MBD2464392.1 AAA family ATPase [Oscillatoria sp. FACHB-1407]